MSSYSQANRYLYLEAPVSPMLLAGFSGHEGISQLFHFQLDVLVPKDTTVPFESILGKGISFGLLGTESSVPPRDLHGIVIEMAQGAQDRDFTNFKMTVAPQLWVLTCKSQNRIFQQKSVPDVLQEVFTGIKMTTELRGTYEKREYVVQYQESDFAFASRLMEEEGIYYFFKFTHGQHELVLADTPQSHPDIPGKSEVIYEDVEGGVRDDERVTSWTKQQNWGSGKYTLWDHHIDLPHKQLDAERTVLDSVQVGKVSHKLKVNGNDGFEVYENPGGYAKRFDDINKGGGDQASELAKVFQDKDRVVKIRTQQGETSMLSIYGESTQRQFTAGHKFQLARHFDANAKFVLTAVTHSASEADVRSDTGGDDAGGHYTNTFNCIPYAPPYKFSPARVTSRPVIHGPQTAQVVGPAGEEIFTDKYGRIKVQFHWDREGKYDESSSCWLPVATSWAGQQWGIIHIPRVGQEVVVSFFEGDPDRPIVTGSVYNPEMMPPWTLPDNKTQSGIKTRSTLKGGAQNFNQIRFEDKKGSEEIYVHAEHVLKTVVEADETRSVGASRTTTVEQDDKETVKKGDHELTVEMGNRAAKILKGNDSLKVTLGNVTHEAPVGTYKVQAMQVQVMGTTSIKLQCGASMIEMTPASITIVSPIVKINS